MEPEVEYCACGAPLFPCERCGDERCLACDPYDDDDECWTPPLAGEHGEQKDGD